MFTKEFSDTKKTWIKLRCEANYWKGQHRKAIEREKILRAKIWELEGTLDSQEAQIKELLSEFEKKINEEKLQIIRLNKRIDELKAQNVWLKQRLFGRQTEQGKDVEENGDVQRCVPPSVDQSNLKRRRGQQPGASGHGRKIRADLPFVEIIHDLNEHEKTCPVCGLALKPFPATADSEDIHFEVRIIRRVHKRKCYVPSCNCGFITGIVSAKPVAKLIPKGMFSVELWAHILAEKFLFQRPMSRVLDVLALQGLYISQGTITGGLQKIKEIAYPLYTRILEHNRASDRWHMDETRWMVFAYVEGKVGYRWWLWVSVTKNTVVYILDPSRSARVIRDHLGNNPEGILNVDRYSAYKAIESEQLKLSFCWGHVRRDYMRIHDTYPKLRLWAAGWIKRINMAFHLNNRRLVVLSDKEQFELADKALREHIDVIRKTCLDELMTPEVHPVICKALESLQKHWKGLLVFLDHPEIPMDNNLSERKLREAALGRKNYYGSSSVWSGDMTVALFSIFQTARHNGLDPVKYLTAYLHAAADNNGKAPGYIDDFLPWNLSEERKTAWKYPP